MEKQKAWQYLFQVLFSRLLQAWKDWRLRAINWACDVASGNLAVVDHNANLQWHRQHTQHINVAEAMALIKAATIMPNGTAVWTNSKVAMGWSKHVRRGWPISAVLSWILVQKDIQVFWLPSAWNPADKFAWMRPPFPKKIGNLQQRSLGSVIKLNQCQKCPKMQGILWDIKWWQQMWVVEHDCFLDVSIEYIY